MLANYLKTALRTLLRHRGYTALNLLGLAVGLACFVLILRYVQFELSFDRFHAGADRIYRVVQQQPGNVYLGSDRFAVTQAGLARALEDDLPEVASATTFSEWSGLLGHGDRHFFEQGLIADSAFFDVFTFPLRRGDPRTALARPFTMVLTEATAQKLFGDADPMGQTVLYQDRDAYTVTGVVADPPEHSHIRFAFLLSIVSDQGYLGNLTRWGNSSWYTYFTLAPGHAPASVEAKLPALLATRRSAEDAAWEAHPPRLYLEALVDVHLRSHINFDLGAKNDIRYVYLFAAIAVVILLLACVNYTNLAVARSIQRAKEVGMRKVVGASRLQLVGQYLGESMLLAFAALGLGLVLAQLGLPAFAQWLERDLTLDYLGDLPFVLQLVGVTALVGLVAGGYPAFVLTAVGPASVLKGGAGVSVGRSRLRSVLVVGQYTAAIALAIGSLVIYQQLRFIRTKNLGLNRDHVVVVRLRDPALHKQLPALRAELLRDPRVASVTVSTHLPTNVGSSTSLRAWEGSPEEARLPIYQLGIDHDFFDVFQIRLADGRAFSPDHPSDTSGAYLLNETAVRQLGWASAVGKRLTYQGTEGTVVGVVKDFHMHSMHQAIEPLLLRLESRWASYVSLRLRPGDPAGALAAIEQTFKPFTAFPFEYQFLDEAFDELYRRELRLGQSFGYFTLLALFVASLGLFGLAAFTAQQRTKEIGIRKVLGASVPGLVLLLSKQFARLVLVAFVLAAPPAYYLMDTWLQDFTYRVALSWPTFVATGLAALAVSLLTVSYQAVRAALTNPVKALRYE